MLAGRFPVRPEFKVIAQLHSIGRQFCQIDVRKVQGRDEPAAELLQFFQVVGPGNRLFHECQQPLEIFFGCLLGMKTGGVVGAITCQKAFDRMQITLRLEQPAPVIELIVHRGSFPLVRPW